MERFPLLTCLWARSRHQAMPEACRHWLPDRTVRDLTSTLDTILALSPPSETRRLERLAALICACLHQVDGWERECGSVFGQPKAEEAQWLIQAAALLLADARWPDGVPGPTGSTQPVYEVP